MNCYPFIEAERAGSGSASRACQLLKVSRAAFYQHRSGPSRRDRENAGITAEITAVHKDSKGRYGAPRVHAELRRRGRRHGRKRVARLMRAAGIRGKTPKRWRKTTIPAFRGTGTGGYAGRAATGRAVDEWVVTIMHFDGDRVAREWIGADKLGLFIQLGVVDNPWPS